MIRSHLTIPRLVVFLAAMAAVGGSVVIGPILSVVAAGALGLVVVLILRDPRRPIGRASLALLCCWIVTAPALLFYDPATYAPARRGHIDREPRDSYQLVSDDAAYVAASRTWDRAVGNLMVPHNTHIVPIWRLVTWALVAYAGSLRELPSVLAVASYGILIAVMMMIGRLVARETGRTTLGLAAMSLVGTTSLMLTPAIWFSGGQPLWAGLGILATLWYAQSYRRGGRWPNLVFAGLAAAFAGGLWSAGHLAGPAAGVYLWFDGRRRCRYAAVIPLLATAAAVALVFSLAAQPLDSKVSFHGRSVREALNPIQGAITTARSIPESLIFANLGLDVKTTPIQGLVLTIGLALFWANSRRRRHPEPEAAPDSPPHSPRGPAAWSLPWPSFAFNPLECAGIATVVGCYMLEWTFRGYLEYQFMRTINPYVVVPWYDVIPQIGAVLFATGWWSGPGRPAAPIPRPTKGRPERPTRSAAFGLAALSLALLILNRPRVDALVRANCPPMLASEEEKFRIPRLQTMRANAIVSLRVERQRRYLRRLDQAEAVARRLGIGQDGIRAVFGHLFIPHSTGRLLLAHRDLYDVAAILDLPPHGRTTDPATIRAAMATYLNPEPEIPPDWLAPGEKWPEP